MAEGAVARMARFLKALEQEEGEPHGAALHIRLYKDQEQGLGF
jgi:hypothetical protein